MTDDNQARAARAAKWLDSEHAGRRRFAPLRGEDAPRSIAEAYDVQDALVALRIAAGRGARAGHKIALTTPTMRKFVGYDDSIAGQVLGMEVHGSPATARLGGAGRLGFECELAFLVGRDTRADGPPSTRDGISAHIAAVCAAFELIDDRNADYASFGRDDGATMLSLAADNAWNAGVVLGAWKRDWTGLDLATLHGVAAIKGEVVGEGHGRDVLGHPLDAMLWIARHLHGRGQVLREGEFVITGSLVTSKFPRAGDAVRFSVEGVGEAQLQVTD